VGHESRPEAKITNSAMFNQLIVAPWGAIVRKDWKVMPESQLSSIMDVYPERGKWVVMWVPYICCPCLRGFYQSKASSQQASLLPEQRRLLSNPVVPNPVSSYPVAAVVSHLQRMYYSLVNMRLASALCWAQRTLSQTH
jgi:hypothetical protein